LPEKNLVQYEEIRLAARFFAASAAILIAVGSIFLLPPFFSLTLEKEETDRALRLEEEAARNFGIGNSELLIPSVKNSLSSISGFVSAGSRASAVLDGIFSEAGEGISIQNLTVSKDSTLIVSGKAATRRALLDFERKLRAAGRLQELAAPVPVKEFDINFTMRGKFKAPYWF